MVHITCSAYGMESSAVLSISVEEKTLAGITVSHGPAKFVYQEGEPFDTAALKIRASYTDKTTEILSGGFSCDTNGPLSPSNKTVTVSYTLNHITMTDSFDVIVAGARQEPARDEAGVYHLETAGDMLWFSDAVNIQGNTGIHVCLEKDIDLRAFPEFSPVGRYGSEAAATANGGKLTYSWENKFQGILDGNQKSVILNLEGSGCTALVGYADGAVIKNLTVKGTVKGKKGYTAGVAARSDLGITLSGCINQAKVLFEDEGVGLSYTAGIIGMAVNASVSGCKNQGEIISSGGIAAGIAGESSGTCVFEKCENSGTITGSGNYIAGIAARAALASFTDCDNLGAVHGTAGYVGGIAGGSTQNLAIKRCSNLGRITGGTMAGGIVGGGPVSLIENSYNKGQAAVEDSTSAGCVGGLIAKKGNIPLDMVNCYNTGRISSAGGALAGSLAGDASSGTKDNRMALSNCYHTGTKSVGSSRNVSGKALKRTAAQLSRMAGTLGNAYKNSCTGAVLKRQTAQSRAYGNWSPKNLSKVGEHRRSCKNCKLLQKKVVKPRGTRITRLWKKGGTLKITWKKQPVQTAGYQIQYGVRADFSGRKSADAAGRNKTSLTLKKIKPSKKYYVRIRTYQVVNGRRYYSGWSKVKTKK